MQYNTVKYWESQQNKDKLLDYEIRIITFHLVKLRREILDAQEQIEQNRILIKEGQEILTKHKITLPNWKEDYL